MGGTGEDPQTCKTDTFFLMPLALHNPLSKFSTIFGRNFQTKICNLIVVVRSGNFCLIVSANALVYWKLLKIGLHSAKDTRKMSPFCKFEGPPLPSALTA